MRIRLPFALLLCGPLTVAVMAEGRSTVSISERYSYAMGVRLGELLKQQGIVRLDSQAFAAAIDDVLTGRPLRLSESEMQEAMLEQQETFAERRRRLAQDNLEAGRAFLTQNAARADVAVMPSGLQYRVLRSGSGARPSTADKVRVHYQGRLLDGTLFDSSVARGEPVEFVVASVIPGFREAIAQMRVGDLWQVYIPSHLAYGETGAGTGIGPNETLVVEIELLDLVR